MIRLRQSLEAGLRHPLLGPLLLLCLGLLLAFLIFHTIEHGVEGLLFSCVMVAAVILRILVVLGRISLARREVQTPPRRGPPQWAPSRLPAIPPPVAVSALPLRL